MLSCARARSALALAAGLCACLAQAAQARNVTQVRRPVARPPVAAPLPPPRPKDLDAPAAPATNAAPARDLAKPATPSACLATFAERGGIALPPAPETAEGACAISEPVTFRVIAMPDGSKVELDSAVTVRCAFALEVVGWVRDDLPAIATRENTKLAALVGVGGHACRPRNGAAGAPISEHASGNALDLSGLRLESGRTISLSATDAATRLVRDAVQESACARFATVLGPGADSSHKDHLHLDMRKRSRDFKICQWTVE